MFTDTFIKKGYDGSDRLILNLRIVYWRRGIKTVFLQTYHLSAVSCQPVVDTGIGGSIANDIAGGQGGILW